MLPGLKKLSKHLLYYALVLWGVSLVSFFMVHLAPGEPTQIFISPQVRPEDLAIIKQNLGLNKPVILQYLIWLKNILLGNWGYSYSTGQPVLKMILERVPATLLLMTSSLLLTLLIAIPLGIYSALNKGKRGDVLCTLLAFVGMSLPAFWTALVAILIFALYLGWFPTSGISDYSGNLFSVLWHLVLPVAVLTFGSLAGLLKYQRNSMLQALNSTYIKSARARGLPERTVILKHALKNSLLPVITILGLSLPGLFGGTVVIEQIFAWPGMGSLGIQAIFQRDYPLIMGELMLSAFLIIIGNQLADFLYRLADPRIHYE
jgi:peptide/nickel transport system permease protein